jgi:alginate O-acetyltransferase complex protein AlgI
MLFNSTDFLIFLPAVFLVYWFVVNKSHKLQNLFIAIASYVFYGWWDWRFLSLIGISTIVDYSVGRGLAKARTQKSRKLLLLTSIFVNLGFLGFFKYFNFFVESFISAFSSLGVVLNSPSLSLILPVGISFYTFQTLSYTIDVYKGKLQPNTDPIAFAAYVSFFPQLVAGPIERAKNLLPQFHKTRQFDYSESVNGLKQILWGMFKKIVIADRCATIANLVFRNPSRYTGSALIFGLILFSIQIYGDFSGYSDIAIGTARLFGFRLMKNFAYPYFSRDIAEFWRRWHISLTTWFRDYLYIPLGGSRVGVGKKIRNIFIVFLISGFWHGASWTFVIWGAIHAFYYLPLQIFNRHRKNIQVVAKGRFFPSFRDVINILSTFTLVAFAWIFFRAENLNHAIAYIKSMISLSIFSIPNLQLKQLIITLGLLVFFFSVEWLGRESEYAIENLFNKQPRIIRWGFCAGIIFLIGMFMQTKDTPFIYFQF